MKKLEHKHTARFCMHIEREQIHSRNVFSIVGSFTCLLPKREKAPGNSQPQQGLALPFQVTSSTHTQHGFTLLQPYNTRTSRLFSSPKSYLQIFRPATQPPASPLLLGCSHLQAAGTDPVPTRWAGQSPKQPSPCQLSSRTERPQVFQ